ncbi:MAG: hypothetical protein ACYCZO_17210 [Daejeonella sp.]
MKVRELIKTGIQSLSFPQLRYRDDRLWKGLQNGNTGINTLDNVKT